MGLNTKNRVVIWGLRNVSHTHRYIHKGFYETFVRLGFDCHWVDDQASANELLTPDTVVITVNLACEKLQYRADVKYILHNVEREEFRNRNNVLMLQVLTTDSTGEAIDGTVALYNKEQRTLYQPWGIPSEPEDWLSPNPNPGKTEFWVGSVWNNPENQGNLVTIADYSAALEARGYRFKKANKMKLGVPAFLGGKGVWLANSISDDDAAALIYKSPFGAAVVGEWQKEHGYVPCRLFKNVAAGHIPSSNADFTSIFQSTFVGNTSYSEMINTLEGVSVKDRVSLVGEAQREMGPYTYSKAIERLLNHVL